MKKPFLTLLVAAFILAGAGGSFAADKKHLGGPQGGRILEKTEPKAEFFVEKDRSVTIHFYDAALNPVAHADQAVTVLANSKGSRSKLSFKKAGKTLVSTSKLPAGDGYGLVVQFKANKTTKPQNFRFTYAAHICGGCNRAEYACTCDE